MAEEPMLRVQNVVKKFNEVTALKGVSIDVAQGEIVSFLGPSGCGKTTLLRTIGGFYRQDEGDVYLEGKLINDIPPEQRETVMFFQNYALFPHMNVYENVTYGLRVNKYPRDEIKKRAQEILSLIQLDGMEDRAPSQLSGGQQQRVALARALILNPKILLLDEPLSNLDANLREYMRDEIKKIQHRLNLTIIFVTHDQQEAMSIASKIAVMQEGIIEQIGNPFEIYRYPESIYVANFVGDTNFINGTVTSVSKENENIIATGMTSGQAGNSSSGAVAAKTADGGQKLEAGGNPMADWKGHLGTAMEMDTTIGQVTARSPRKLYQKGTSIKTVIRPENIGIFPRSKTNRKSIENSHTHVFEGTVTKSTYLGDIIVYEVDVGPENLLVKASNPKEDEYLPPDSEVFVAIPDDIHVISVEQPQEKDASGEETTV